MKDKTKMPKVKLRAGNVLIPGELNIVGNRIEFNFGYAPALQAEIKMMEGAKYHGYDEKNPRKIWSVKDSQRNWFQIDFLRYNPNDPSTRDPYAPYEAPLLEVTSNRPLYDHQLYGKSFVVTRRQCILAHEMGCIDGEAIVHINRAKRGLKIPLRDLFRKFNGLNNRSWDSAIPTYIRSLMNGQLGLNQIKSVLKKGNKPVFKLTLKSGEVLRLTGDHEVAISYTNKNIEYSRTDSLKKGDIVLSDEFPKYDTVVSCTADGTADVYDVVCADPHRNFVANGIIVHNCGKTLVSIEAQEWAADNDRTMDPGRDIWYVGPGAALQQVMADYDEWKCDFRPQFMTYEHLVKIVTEWKPGTPAPKFVIFDESSRIKNPTAKRSIAAKHVADAVRAEYGPNGYVLLMSGSPAPKHPADWWHQCEVACPGFLREGTFDKFKKRLALIEIRQNEGGMGYPHLVTWLDDETKCAVCGQLDSHPNHSDDSILGGIGHQWKKSINEVSFLYERMNGLVDVKFKKDCLNLPEKIYQVIKVKTPLSTLNAAKIISKRAKNMVQALTLLRELSDGFQYKEEVVDSKECPDCNGEGSKLEKYNPEEPEEVFNQNWLVQNIPLLERLEVCKTCEGRCITDIYTREVKQLPSPKEDAIREIIESHDDVGRLVIYAGFTGSVQRVTDICLSMGWHVLRVDGRGWAGYTPEGLETLPQDRKSLYHIFRYGQAKFPKVVFVGQASAAGMGLNLSASPTIVFFSNDFNFESRIQAEDRNHRPGIEKTLALHGLTQNTIIDIVNLESDALIIQNHKKKKKLQHLTMGVLQEAFNNIDGKDRVF